MLVHNLTTVDGFVILDLGADAPHVGTIRTAKKVLQSSSTDLSRTLTYRNAVFGRQFGGAVVGINTGDAAAALASAAEELAALAASHGLHLDPSPQTGVAVESPSRTDLRSSERARLTDGRMLEHEATAAGIVAATAAASDGVLDGVTIAVVGTDPIVLRAAAMASRAGARVVAITDGSGGRHHPAGFDGGGLDAAIGGGLSMFPGEEVSPSDVVSCEASVLWVGQKTGAIDHDNVAAVNAGVLVPVGPLPVTARGYAVARRRGIVVLPDFVTLGGGLAAWDATADEADEAVLARARAAVAEIVAAVLGHDEGPIVGAGQRAEAFLRTWRDAVPFGRPFAP